MGNDRTIRRLSALQESASTARVLNLVRVHKLFPDNESIRTSPFFRNKVLDRCLIVKHRLRPNEYVHFKVPPTIVTKILIPIDGTDLRYGAHSFFVGQNDYEKLVQDTFGQDLKPGSRDRMVLDLVTSLPTLDPFLLKEFLAKNDVHPAQAYFAISDGDVQRMFDFVRQEIMALVTLSAGGGAGSVAYASRLVEKLLSNAPDAGFEPLRDTLKLTDQEYSDGMFCWRGFLYYKWVLGDLMKPMTDVLMEIETTQGRGPRTAETSTYIPQARSTISRLLVKTSTTVQEKLDVYNNAYFQLTRMNQPAAFREFLLSAPAMFYDLGEQLGAMQHIISFWRYRFPAGERAMVGHEDLMDIFLDFEESLSFVK